MARCERCGRESIATTMSWFNTEMICCGPGSCDEREEQHPEFERAKQVETEAVRRGDHNFQGVGLPGDL